MNESIESQPEPERRDASPTSPEPSLTNDPLEEDALHSAVAPAEDVGTTPPVAEASESPSDVVQAEQATGASTIGEAPIPPAPADCPVTVQQPVVPVGSASTIPPPGLRECVRALPDAVLSALHVGRDQDDEPFLQLDGRSVVHRLRDPGTRVILAQALNSAIGSVRPTELQGLIDEIASYARLYGRRQHVWIGVAPNDEGGVDHDLVDEAETVARVVPGRHYLITGGRTTLFYRSPRMVRRLWSKAGGDFYRLLRYLTHLRFEDQRLVGAWVLYIMAHPKVPTTVFIHLILFGPQGSGKTLLAAILLSIIAPSSVSLQPLPRSAVDLAIAAAQGPLCAFDNVRTIPQWLSDLLCLMATSGVVTGRQLYSNDGQSVINLHCPAIITSLHSVIAEPDLADRSLQINVPLLDTERRRDPAVLMREFEQDRPIIYRGALELIAEIYQQLPLVEPVNPQRVYRFSHWLAALERVEGVPAGGYQKWYRDSLGQVMLDSLHESALNVAVLDFIETQPQGFWSGTAAELLIALNRATGRRSWSGGDWPVNEIALSRRLRASVAAFRTQGIDIRFTRGRVRRITISRVGGAGHE